MMRPVKYLVFTAECSGPLTGFPYELSKAMEFQKNAQLEQSSHEPLSVVPAAEVVDMEAGAQAEEAMISLDQMELGIRHAFARKVFTLLIVCIIILMATIAPFLYVTELRSWFRVTSSSIWVSVASGLLYLVACAVVSFWLPQKCVVFPHVFHFTYSLLGE